MKIVLYCAVICLIYTLTCMTGYSSSVYGKPLMGYLTKTQRSRVISRDLGERSESSEESDSSAESDSSEDQSGIKVPMVPTCPDGWRRNGTSCYALVENEVSWEDARSGCQANNSTLVEITTKAELEFLYSEFAFIRVWIGLQDIAMEGSFIWDDSKIPVSFENWATGEPYSGLESYDCVYMYNDPGNGWYTLMCNQIQDYICERQAELNR